MTTHERKSELIAQGFYVEDMQAEYGAEYAGMFRWMNDKTGDFQDDDVSYSVDAAWARADRHARVAAL